MDLREGEQILKVYHHHPMPFVFRMVGTVLAFFPFFLLLYFAKSSFSTGGFIMTNIILFSIFALVCAYVSLVYWLDKLVITNERIIYIDWIFLTLRKESEAFLDDIEDIQTQEKGFMSKFRIFDYGRFKLETAASSVCIDFIEAPNPEGIRKFVYHIKQQ